MDHFRSEAYKCQGSGPTRIGDFTGFACTVTATVVEEGGETEGAPGIAPADRWMQARTRTNVRGGLGTQYDKVGLLEAGEKVHVTGEAGAWLRIGGPDGSTAFVHSSLLVPPAPQGRDAAAGVSPKCAGMSEGAECWVELTDPLGCYLWVDFFSPEETWFWSGVCSDDVAHGRGTLVLTWDGKSNEEIGTLNSGKRNGPWVRKYGSKSQCHESGSYVNGIKQGVWEWHHCGYWTSSVPYIDGKMHGHWVTRYPDGNVHEGPYVDGERHGTWVFRYADGRVLESDYRNGSSDGQPGVYILKDGTRIPGRFSGEGDCFRDSNGYLRVWWGDKENCTSG